MLVVGDDVSHQGRRLFLAASRRPLALPGVARVLPAPRHGLQVVPYVENKARLAGQPGSEPRSPASWPKVGLKPLAVADPPPSAKPCCSPAFNYKKGPLSARSRKLAMAAPHIASLRLRGRPGLLLCLAAFGASPCGAPPSGGCCRERKGTVVHSHVSAHF